MDDPEEIAVTIGLALARSATWKAALVEHAKGRAIAQLRQITVLELRLEAVRAAALGRIPVRTPARPR